MKDDIVTRECHAFARHLICEVGLPILSEGYGALVRDLQADQSLHALAGKIGVHALIDSDHPAMEALKKQNKEFATEFERNAEMAMREAVQLRFSGDGIVGEEHGVIPSTNTRKWVFDPIDGTSAMIRTAFAQAFGIVLTVPAPAFGVTVAMVEGETPIVGVVAELVAKHENLELVQMFSDEVRSIPHAPDTLEECVLACTAPSTMFSDAAAWGRFQALCDAAKMIITDLNCVGFMRLLTGEVQVVYEADLAYHDAAALLPPLKAAGFIVSDEAGEALSFATEHIGSQYRILAAHPQVYDQALARIHKGVPLAQNGFARREGALKGYAKKFTV